MTFIAICLALTAFVAGYFYSVFRRTKLKDDVAASKTLYLRRMRELHEDVETGELLAELADAAQQDIVRVTMDDEKQIAHRHNRNAPVVPSTVIALLIVVSVSTATYLAVGDLDRALGRLPAQTATAPVDEASILAAIESLKEQLAIDPENPQGWALLGRTMMAMGDYDQAVSAFDKANQLVPNAPAIMLQYADALAMQSGGDLTVQSRQLVHEVLEIEPNNISALWLAGLGAAEQQDIGQAQIFLKRARELSAAAGASTIELDQIIAQLAPDPASVKSADNISDNDANSLPAIPITVEIAPKLAASIDGTETLFVFARATGVSGPPIAVRRESNISFPFTTTLDETMAMAPQFRLTAGQTITVAARLSKSGQALPQTGDLVGHTEPFNYPSANPDVSQPLKIVINDSHP